MTAPTRGALALALVAAVSVLVVGLVTGGNAWAVVTLVALSGIGSFFLTQRINAKNSAERDDSPPT